MYKTLTSYLTELYLLFFHQMNHFLRDTIFSTKYKFARHKRANRNNINEAGSESRHARYRFYNMFYNRLLGLLCLKKSTNHCIIKLLTNIYNISKNYSSGRFRKTTVCLPELYMPGISGLWVFAGAQRHKRFLNCPCFQFDSFHNWDGQFICFGMLFYYYVLLDLPLFAVVFWFNQNKHYCTRSRHDW